MLWGTNRNKTVLQQEEVVASQRPSTERNDFPCGVVVGKRRYVPAKCGGSYTCARTASGQFAGNIIALAKLFFHVLVLIHGKY